MRSPPTSEGARRTDASRAAANAPPSLVSLFHTLPIANGTGTHVACIMGALHALQPCAHGPSSNFCTSVASSACLPAHTPTFQSGAAAWLCSRLDALWTMKAASGAPRAVEELSAVVKATHPRTQIVLQLLALDFFRQEGPPVMSSHNKADATDLSLLHLNSLPTAVLPTAIATAATTVSPIPCATPGAFRGKDVTAAAPASLDDNRDGAHHRRYHRLPIVWWWLWRSAAALPTARALASSPFHDLSAVLVEWATLALPAWSVTPEEARWREVLEQLRHFSCTHRRESSLSMEQSRATGKTEEGATTAAGGVLEGATRNFPPPLPSLSDAVTADEDVIGLVGVDNNFFTAEVEDRTAEEGGEEGQNSEAASEWVNPVALDSAPSDAPALPPRRVLRLGVAVPAPAAATLSTSPVVPTTTSSAITTIPAAANLPLHEASEDQPMARTAPRLTVLSSTQMKSGCDTAGTATLTASPAVGCRGDFSAARMSIVPAKPTGASTPTASAARTLRVVQLRSASPPPEPIKQAATATTTKAADVAASTDIHRIVRSGEEKRKEEYGPPEERRGGGLLLLDDEDASQPNERCTVELALLRRWSALAPFILYAPPLSDASRQARELLHALGFRGEPRFGEQEELKDGTDATPHLSCAPPSSAGRASPVRPARNALPLRGNFRSQNVRSPQGRLPPLMTAYAWLHDAPLRSAWLRHLLAPSPMPGEAGDEGNGSDDSKRIDAGTEAAPTSFSELPNPRVALHHHHHHHHDRGKYPREWASFAFPCVTLADAHVAALLDELLRHPPSPHRDAAFTTGGDGPFPLYDSVLPPTFEERFFNFFCYPLAGVFPAPPAPPPSQKAATAVTPPRTQQATAATVSVYTTAARAAAAPSARCDVEVPLSQSAGQLCHAYANPSPRPPVGRALTQSEWCAYVEFRCGKKPRQGKALLPFAPRGSAVREVEGVVSSPSADVVCDLDVGCAADEGCGRGAAAAAAAALSASLVDGTVSCTYAAVMDMAVLVIFSELRRVCAATMADEMALLARSLLADDRAARVLEVEDASCTGTQDIASRKASTVMMTSRLSSVGHLTSSACTSLQYFLEAVLESDGLLQWYVCDDEGMMEEMEQPPDDAAYLARALERNSESRQLAARLWLALVAVLALGESAAAQYVRGVLLPPACLSLCHAQRDAPMDGGAERCSVVASPISESDVGEAPSALSRTKPSSTVAPPATVSLLPFGMPGVFRSTLEDLYGDECGAVAAATKTAVDPLACSCETPSAPGTVPLCSPDLAEDEEAPRGPRGEGLGEAGLSFRERLGPLPQSRTAATEDSPRSRLCSVTTDTLSIATAVALRHPRVVLRLLRFLWQLSSAPYALALSGEPASTPSGPPESSDSAISRVGPVHGAPDVSSDAPFRVAGDDGGDECGGTESGTRPCRTEFTARLSCLVECLQLASLAGLPPPVSTSLVPQKGRPASFAPLSASGGVDTAAGAVHRAADERALHPETKSSISSFDFTTTAEGPAALAVRTSAAEQSSGGGAPHRLSIFSPHPPTSTAATTSATALTAVGVRKRCHDRGESQSAPVVDTNSFYSIVNENKGGVGVGRAKRPRLDDPVPLCSTREAEMPPQPRWPPALDSLAEVQVRWVGDAPKTGGNTGGTDVRLSLKVPPTSALRGDSKEMNVRLLDLVSDTLWAILRHIHIVLRSTDVRRGDASDRQVSTPSSSSTRPLPSTGNTAGDLKVVPLRLRDVALALSYEEGVRTMTVSSRPVQLRLSVHPVFIRLQRLWQALLPDFPARCAARCGMAAVLGRKARLEVLFPSTLGSAHRAVDLCVYSSLTASLRGVLCMILGFAFHTHVWTIWRQWRVFCDDAAATVVDDDAMTAASAAPPSRSGTLPSGSPHAPALYAWLAKQLHTLQDELLQPLQRVLHVAVPEAKVHPLPSGTSAPSERLTVPAAWLTYAPLSRVLIPALLRRFDAAVGYAHPRHGGCTDRGAGTFDAPTTEHHRAEAQRVWMQIRKAVLQAGVQSH